VKALLPVMIAGGTFAAAAVVGLLSGVVAAERIGEPLLVPAGLMLGVVVGAVSALALLLRSL
jgi:hypothetical protein